MFRVFIQFPHLDNELKSHVLVAQLVKEFHNVAKVLLERPVLGQDNADRIVEIGISVLGVHGRGSGYARHAGWIVLRIYDLFGGFKTVE